MAGNFADAPPSEYRFKVGL
jgi:hypothetical protein